MNKELLDYKKRDSRFELLRIIIMFGIVIGHYMCHGGVLSEGGGLNRFLASGISIFGGKTSNDIFIMISAWFLVDKKAESLLDKSIMKLIFRTTFFSVVLWGIYCLIIGEVDLQLFIQSIEWVWHGYGFIVAYILLVFLYPLMNKVVDNVSQGTLKQICFSLLLWITILKGMINVLCVFTFILIYFTIAYIKRYMFDLIRKEWCIYSFIICSIIIKLFQFICQLYFPPGIVYFIDEESDIFVLINALNIFLVVTKCSPFYNNVINFIAKGMITVYLLHENFLIRPYIWNYFKCKAYYNSNYMIMHCMGCSVLIMIVGVGVGALYELAERKIGKGIIRMVKR